MKDPYPKPPIVEAVCEMRFLPNQPWDWTIPGLIYAEIQSEYPKKSEQHSLEVLLGAKGGKVSGSPMLLRFAREDGSALVVVGPDLISVNFLRPYSNWEAFRSAIERARALYVKIANPKAFKRIGLRYINRIELPDERVEIEAFLTAVPTVPPALPQTFGQFMQRVELPFPSLPGTLVLQSGSHPEAAGRPAFLLDLDVVTTHPDDIPLATALEWIDKAHEHVEQAFEACITDKTRGLFLGD